MRARSPCTSPDAESDSLLACPPRRQCSLRAGEPADFSSYGPLGSTSPIATVCSALLELPAARHSPGVLISPSLLYEARRSAKLTLGSVSPSYKLRRNRSAGSASWILERVKIGSFLGWIWDIFRVKRITVERSNSTATIKTAATASTSYLTHRSLMILLYVKM